MDAAEPARQIGCMPLPAFIPEGAKWFLADLVLAIRVGKGKRVTVHVNTVLVRADSPTEAFKKAAELGRSEELTYENAAGEPVRFTFLGLKNLDVVHDELEHGSELRFTESIGRTMKKARALVARRRRLSVFRPREPSAAPDYASGSLRRELEAAMKAPPGSRVSRGAKAGR